MSAAISALFSKQHYIVDVVAGVFLASVAYVVFLKNYARDSIPELDRRLAPVFAPGTIGFVSLGVAGFWVAYKLKSVA